MSTYSAPLIQQMKKMKCPTPKLLKANVVYKFDCLCYINISYIGKTKRHLATRIKEHRLEKSAIGQHLQTCHTCKHNFNENQFQIQVQLLMLGIKRYYLLPIAFQSME